MSFTNILPSQIPDSLKQLMLAIANSPTLSLPNSENNWFAQVLPSQNFALYHIYVISSLFT